MSRFEYVNVNGHRLYGNDGLEVYQCSSLPDSDYTSCNPDSCRDCRNAERHLIALGYPVTSPNTFRYFHPRSATSNRILVVPSGSSARIQARPTNTSTTTTTYTYRPHVQSRSREGRRPSRYSRSSHHRSVTPTNHITVSQSNGYYDRAGNQIFNLDTLSSRRSSSSSSSDDSSYQRGRHYSFDDENPHRNNIRTLRPSSTPHRFVSPPPVRGRSRSNSSVRRSYEAVYGTNRNSDGTRSSTHSSSYSLPRSVTARTPSCSPIRRRNNSVPRVRFANSPERSPSPSPVIRRNPNHHARSDTQNGPHSECVTHEIMSGGVADSDSIAGSSRRNANMRQDELGIWHECDSRTSVRESALADHTVRYYDAMDDDDLNEWLSRGNGR